MPLPSNGSEYVYQRIVKCSHTLYKKSPIYSVINPNSVYKDAINLTILLNLISKDFELHIKAFICLSSDIG
jgi:hypothetical protein